MKEVSPDLLHLDLRLASMTSDKEAGILDVIRRFRQLRPFDYNASRETAQLTFADVLATFPRLEGVSVTGLTGIDTFADHVVTGHSFVRTLRLLVGGPGLVGEDEDPWKYDPADRQVLDDMVTSLVSRLTQPTSSAPFPRSPSSDYASQRTCARSPRGTRGSTTPNDSCTRSLLGCVHLACR